MSDAWWQTSWAAQAAGHQASGDTKTFPSERAEDRVAGDAARAAGLDANPTQGYVPGSDVIEAKRVHTLQGFSPAVLPTDAARPRSTQTGDYTRLSYQAWTGKPAQPVAVPYHVVRRGIVAPHPVLARPPVAAPASKQLVYS